MKKRRSNSSKAGYIVLSFILVIFIILCAVIVYFGGSLSVPAEDSSAGTDTFDTSKDTSAETDTDTGTDTSDTVGSDTVTDTETTETETTDTEPPETTTSWISGIPDMPKYDADTLGIKGGYTPDTSLADALAKAISAFDRPVSFFAVDIKTGTSLSYNATKAHNAASMVKAAYAYYICREIDAGRASLDEKLTYTAADTIYGDNVIGKAGLGKEYTLYQVLYYTIVSSDNEGYYMLTRRFGRDGYDAFLTSLGCSTPKISGSRWPDVTSLDMAKIWQEIYEYRDENETGKMLYGLFEQVEYMNFIELALGVPVANKAGWNSKQFNDSGVVSSKDSTYILVILSDGSYFTSVKKQYYDIIRAIDAMMNDAAKQ